MTRKLTRASLLMLLFLSSCKSILVSSGKKADVRSFSFDKEENSGYEQVPGSLIPEPMELTFTPTSFSYPSNSKKEIGLTEYSREQLMVYATAAKNYAKANGFDTTYVFLANMALLPTKKRFYIINTNTHSVEDSGLVSHGRGKGLTIYSRQYSNVPGSNCTSLGRYKILKSYNGTYGLSYRLAGLDKTNNNAITRGVVLHSSGCIPDKENYTPACVSEGCPAVSKYFFDKINKTVQSKKQPILLWIYDSLLEEPVWVKVKEIAPSYAIGKKKD